MWRDLTLYLREVGILWLAIMGGIFGIIWTIASFAIPQMPALWYVIGGAISLLIATFFAWRRLKREARPYPDERFKNAQTVFKRLSHGGKEKLRGIAINGVVEGGENDPEIESCIFLKREYVGGFRSVRPEFSQIVPRLIAEWENSGRQD